MRGRINRTSGLKKTITRGPKGTTASRVRSKRVTTAMGGRTVTTSTVKTKRVSVQKPQVKGSGSGKGRGAGPVQAGEKIPALERTHTIPFDEHALISRMPVRAHVLLDVQKGKSKALKGRGVRGATPEEMRRLFGKKR
ncbi:MAG: hypothetical protein Q8N60_05925 [Candidatus Diapherotrites archaeon]|nr:hypothetical protein [Candidatus Diapherotrites archaeon]